MEKYKIKILKGLLPFFCFLIYFFAKSVSVNAASIDNYNENQVNLDVKSALAIDVNSGQILYAKNANKKLPVASMSKLITVYLTLDAIKNKEISWNQRVQPTKQIVAVSNDPEYSGIPLQMNHSYTIKQLYEATLINSANGPAMLLGEAISGSQQSFVKKMRQQLSTWNITGESTQLVTPSGLPNYTLSEESFKNKDKDAENILSASDMAIIISHLLKEFPQVLDTTSKAHSAFIDQDQIIPMESSNWMLKGLSEYDSNYPVDGLKTGTTDAAGACFSATMQKEGQRIVTVILGAQHVDGTDPSRFTQTKKLMDYIFDHYQIKEITAKNRVPKITRVKIDDGEKNSALVYMKKPIKLWLPKEQKISNLKVKFSKSALQAPITKNEKVGEFYISNLPALNSSHGVGVEATVHENIEEINPLMKLISYISQAAKKYYQSIFNYGEKREKNSKSKVKTKKDEKPYPDPVNLAKAGTWSKKSEDKAYPDLTKVKNLWIRVSLKENRTYIMSGNKPIYTMLSTGGTYYKNKSDTPTGTYYIQEERGDDFYNNELNEGAKYYVSWKDHGVYLFHSVPTKSDGSINKKEAAKLGRSSGSHGCIRLSVPDSKWLAETVPVGTKVVIKDK